MFEASLVCIAKYGTTRATQGDSVGEKKKNRIFFQVLFNLEKERETEKEGEPSWIALRLHYTGEGE